MKFKTAEAVENVVWKMRLAACRGSQNRALINDLFNGAPPYTRQEAIDNKINTNVNDLSAPHMSMSARGQLGNALVTPDPLIVVEVDYGPVYKRREWGMKISAEINKRLKNSIEFQEEEESTYAQVVLHGEGQRKWKNRYNTYPESRG